MHTRLQSTKHSEADECSKIQLTYRRALDTYHSKFNKTNTSGVLIVSKQPQALNLHEPEKSPYDKIAILEQEVIKICHRKNYQPLHKVIQKRV